MNGHEPLLQLAPITDGYLSKRNAAAFSKCRVRQLEKYRIPRYKLPGSWKVPGKNGQHGRVFYKKSDLDKFMEQFKVGPEKSKVKADLDPRVLELVRGL